MFLSKFYFHCLICCCLRHDELLHVQNLDMIAAMLCLYLFEKAWTLCCLFRWAWKWIWKALRVDAGVRRVVEKFCRFDLVRDRHNCVFCTNSVQIKCWDVVTKSRLFGHLKGFKRLYWNTDVLERAFIYKSPQILVSTGGVTAQIDYLFIPLDLPYSFTWSALCSDWSL